MPMRVPTSPPARQRSLTAVHAACDAAAAAAAAEVIMQTSAIKEKPIGLFSACGEVVADMREFGMRGVFRGQGIGIAKAVCSLTMFHEARIFLTECFIARNERLGLIPEGGTLGA
jgi:hypothetical protein